MVMAVAIFFVALYNIFLIGILLYVVNALVNSLVKKDED
jgi:hypothetical protein